MKKNNIFITVLAVLALVLAVFSIILVFDINSHLERYLESNTDEEVMNITNLSDLQRDEEYDQHFAGVLYFQWDPIPNADGYEIEYNYDEKLDNTATTDFYRIGCFYVYNESCVNQEQIRIRPYFLNQNDEKSYGEFSDWINLEIQEDKNDTF